MAVSYKKLFDTLAKNKMTVTELQKAAGYSANISTRIKRSEYISLETIEKICFTLNCKLDDIVEFISDTNTNWR